MLHKELRVGNLIRYGDHVVVVVSLRKEGDDYYIIDGNEGVHGYLSAYEPIPLTDEWLERLGFEGNEVHGFAIGEFQLRRYDSTQARVWWRDRYFGILGRIEYVHQLQNLFYCLTGEELIVK